MSQIYKTLAKYSFEVEFCNAAGALHTTFCIGEGQGIHCLSARCWC